MANERFQVRQSKDELEELDKMIKRLGYKDRSDWFKDMKKQSLEKLIKVDAESIKCYYE